MITTRLFLKNFLSVKIETNADKVRKEETKIKTIMETSDNMMITEVGDRMIWNDPGDKIATEEKNFKYLEQTYFEIATEDATCFLMTELRLGKESIQIQSNGIGQLTMNVKQMFTVLVGMTEKTKKKDFWWCRRANNSPRKTNAFTK